MERRRSVTAQGSTPAPIDDVVNDNKTECLGSRRSLRLSSKTRRDSIAKCMKQNKQIKKNIENAILLEPSPLSPRSVIAQGSTPAPMDLVVSDDEIKRLKSRVIELEKYDIAESIKLRNKQNKENIENAILLESSPLSPRSVIAQGSTPAPINGVVNNDKTERLESRRSLRLSSKTRRDGIAKCLKQNKQNKINIKNAILLESSPLSPRSVIAQGSTPAPIDDVVNDDEIKHLKSPTSIKVLKMTRLTKTVQQMTNNLIERVKSLESIINVMEHMVSNLQTATTKCHYNMERVNDDCLAEIFMYVPACERLKMAMVCKKWKRALNYSWFNVKKLELTYWRYHEFPCCVEKYRTVDEKFNVLKSLLNKCGRYLTILDLTDYNRCNIVPIINDYCPNLVKLRLRFIDTDDTMLSNAFTRLSKLKSLTIVFQMMRNDIIPETLINSLKNVAGTLTELYLLNFVGHLDESCRYPKNLRYVIRRLKALKRFEVAGIRGFQNSFKYLKKNEMSFYFNHNEYLNKFRYLGLPFMKIRKIDLKSCLIKDDTLYTIANTIKELKILTFNCAQITDDGIVALSKMNHLQMIYLNGHSNITDSSIELLKNIVRLSLPHSNKITDVSVTKLVENSPKIEKLLLHYTTSVTANFVKKAAEISSQRKQLLKISIHSSIPDVERYESPYFEIQIIENEEK